VRQRRVKTVDPSNLHAMSQKDVEAWLSSLNSPQLSALETQVQLQVGNYQWLPNSGAQTLGYLSEADVLFYGGRAGGGKSDLLLGWGINESHRGIIFRREYPQLRALEDRILTLIPRKNYRASPPKTADFDGGHRSLEFGAVQHAGDEQKYQGRPHDFIGFDEITHFLYSQFMFLRGWLRLAAGAHPEQRQRVICAGNPPTSDEGAWVIEYWRPWLDPNYPRPAAPGELRWFWRDPDQNKDIEVEPNYYKIVNGVKYLAESRTFIPASLEDNPHLANTRYGSNLNMLPEPLRSQLLYGDFNIRTVDRPWQLVPTEWVMKAQARWTQSLVDECPGIEQIGADIARGGIDNTVLYRRYRHVIFTAIEAPGKKTPDGGSVATMIINALGAQFATPAEPLVIADAIGVGSSVVDHCTSVLARFIGMNVSNKCLYTDKTKKFKFVNMRAYCAWLVREALDPDQDNPLALPPDPGLLGELTGIDWKLTPSGIQLESKDDVKKRIGRSPDKFEALMLSLAPGAEGGQGILDFFKAMAEAETKKQAELKQADADVHKVTTFINGVMQTVEKP
jgi:hypothetical protein